MPPGTQEQAELLRKESRSLVQRLRLWTPARWAAAAPPFGTRADLVRHLAQDLADRAAAAEGQPPRRLPRLDSDLGVPDQLAVTAEDLARAVRDPDEARAATAHLLAHRLDLLEEDVPAGVADTLGMAHVVRTGRGICEEAGTSPLD